MWLTTTWEFALKRYLIALALSQLAAKKVDLSVLSEVAHHSMIHRRNNLHVVKPCVSHDDVERG